VAGSDLTQEQKLMLLRYYYHWFSVGVTDTQEGRELVISLSRLGLISAGHCTERGRKEIASWGDDREIFSAYADYANRIYAEEQAKRSTAPSGMD